MKLNKVWPIGLVLLLSVISTNLTVEAKSSLTYLACGGRYQDVVTGKTVNADGIVWIIDTEKKIFYIKDTTFPNPIDEINDSYIKLRIEHKGDAALFLIHRFTGEALFTNFRDGQITG